MTKTEVRNAMTSMEMGLNIFGNNLDHIHTISRRLEYIMAMAYLKDYNPPEGVIIKQAYELLCETGVYFDEK